MSDKDIKNCMTGSSEPYWEAIDRKRRNEKFKEALEEMDKLIVSNCITETVRGDAIRKDQEKVPLNSVPHSAMLALGRVFGKGMDKYPQDNYRKGMAWSRTINSLERHLLKFILGEDIDEESGCYHIDCILANAAILCEYRITHQELDDRYKYSKEQIEQMLEYKK
jgi:hypothetical protein